MEVLCRLSYSSLWLSEENPNKEREETPPQAKAPDADIKLTHYPQSGISTYSEIGRPLVWHLRIATHSFGHCSSADS